MLQRFGKKDEKKEVWPEITKMGRNLGRKKTFVENENKE